MATTVGTVFPIAPFPYSIGSGGQTANIMGIPVANSQTIVVGDVLVSSSGKAAVGGASGATAANLVFGVSVDKKASIASAGDNDLVMTALAAFGSLFVGSLVGGIATDHTSAYSDLGAVYDIYRATVENCHVLNFADTTAADGARVGAFSRAQQPSFNNGNLVVGTTVNPRVVFGFINSMFY